MYKLTIHHPDSKEVEHEISGDLVTLGRKKRNLIVVGERYVSGNHAEFHRIGEDEYELRDLGSHNGTFVNSKRIERAIVRDGDHLRFGTIDASFSKADPGQATDRPPQAEPAKVAAAASPVSPVGPPAPAPASISPAMVPPAGIQIENAAPGDSSGATPPPAAKKAVPLAPAKPIPALAPALKPTAPHAQMTGPAAPAAAPPKGIPVAPESRPPAPVTPASLPRPGGSPIPKPAAPVPVPSAPASPQKTSPPPPFEAVEPKPAAPPVAKVEPPATELTLDEESLEKKAATTNLPAEIPSKPAETLPEVGEDRPLSIVAADTTPSTEKESDSLRKQIALLNKQVAALRSKNDGLEETHDAVIRGLENKLATMRRENERYENHAKRLEIQVEELEKRREEKTKDEIARKKAFESEIESLKSADRESRDALENAEKQAAEESKALAEARIRSEALSQELREKRDEFETLTSNLEKSRNEFAQEQDGQVATLREELDELQKQRQESEASLRAEIGKLRDALAEKEGALENAHAEIGRFEQGGAETNNALETAHAEIEKVRHDLAAAEFRIREAQKAAEDRTRDGESQIATLLEGIDQLKSEREEARDALAAEKEASTKARAELQADLVAAKERIESLQSELADAKAALANGGSSASTHVPSARPVRVTARKPAGSVARMGVPTPLNLSRQEGIRPKHRALHEHELKTQGIVPAKRPRISRIQIDPIPADDAVVLLGPNSHDAEDEQLKQKNLEKAEAALKNLEKCLFGK